LENLKNELEKTIDISRNNFIKWCEKKDKSDNIEKRGKTKRSHSKTKKIRKKLIKPSRIPLFQGINEDISPNVLYNLYELQDNDYSIDFFLDDFRSYNIDFLPTISFTIQNNLLEINSVMSGYESGKGWCSIMLNILLDIIESEFKMIDIIKMINSSPSFNNGNISGTICYIKIIGDRYPFFTIKNVLTNEEKNIILENLQDKVDWIDFLRDLGYEISNNKIHISNQDRQVRIFEFRKSGFK